MTTKVELVRLTKRSVTVRLPGGEERRIDGRRVLMVWCQKRDLEAHLAGKLWDKELSPTLDDDGNLVVTAMATVV